jgi:hypothetical protein
MEKARSKVCARINGVDSKQNLGVSVLAAVRSEEGVAVALLFHHSIVAVIQ